MIQPKSGRVCVELVTDRQTKSGIFLPEITNKSRVLKGTVISIGNSITVKNKTINAPCSIGDIVFFPRINVDAFEHEGKQLYFPTFEDILSVIS